MTALALTPTRFDFAPLHTALQSRVDTDILAGVSHAVLQGRDLIDVACVGWQIANSRCRCAPTAWPGCSPTPSR